MILILASNTDPNGAEFRQLMDHLAGLPGIKSRVHTERGAETTLTEIYLIGNTQAAGNRGHAEPALRGARGARIGGIPHPRAAPG